MVDNLNEKKWFVYVGDHHEGPFSPREIQGKVDSGEMTSAQYIWSEGMDDWQPMSQVPDFEVLSSTNDSSGLSSMELEDTGSQDKNSSSLTAIGPSDTDATLEATSLEPVSLESKPLTEEQSSSRIEIPTAEEPSINVEEVSEVSELEVAKPERPSPVEDDAPEGTFTDMVSVNLDVTSLNEQERKKRLLRRLLIGALAISALVLVFFYGGSLKLNETSRWLNSLRKIPGLSALLPDIGPELPPLPGANEKDIERVRNIVTASLEQSGPMVGSFLIRSEASSPSLYLFSNLPDGTQFSVFLRGIPGTLLNRVSYEKMFPSLSLKGGMTYTGPIQGEDNGPLPQGEYEIYLVSQKLEAQPEAAKKYLSGRKAAVNPSWSPKIPKDRSFVSMEKQFLGGIRDPAYQERMTAYLSKLKNQSDEEYVGLKMFFDSVDAQIKSTEKKFNEVSRLKNLSQKKQKWRQFHQEWKKETQEIAKQVKNWKPSFLEVGNGWFTRIYKETMGTAKNMTRLHKMNGLILIGKKKLSDKTGLRDNVTKQAEEIGAEIQKLEKMPPPASGLPKAYLEYANE